MSVRAGSVSELAALEDLLERLARSLAAGGERADAARRHAIAAALTVNRQRARLTFGELADRVGTEPGVLASIENGWLDELHYRVVLASIEALEITPKQFLEDVERAVA